MKRSHLLSTAVAAGLVVFGASGSAVAAINAQGGVVGPIGDQYLKFEDDELNRRLEEIRARYLKRTVTPVAAPVAVQAAPVACVPAGSVAAIAPAPAPVVARAPSPADYGIPSYLSPELQARMLEIKMRSGKFAPPAPVRQAAPAAPPPICPEEDGAVAALAMSGPLDPFAGSLPSVQGLDTDVPEPGTLGLLGLGLAGLGLSRRRRKR